jgi:glutamyl-tRNA reductase
MPILIVGLNYKTAPIHIREKVAVVPDKMLLTLQDCQLQTALDEVVILSTCNRMEIIVQTTQKTFDESPLNEKILTKNILIWIARFYSLSLSTFYPYIESFYEKKAVEHLMQVACGLDSMVLGEPQILGQVKNAYMQANQAETLGPYLNRLFQQTFSLAKKVRTDTPIGEHPVSVAYAAVSLAKRIFSNFESLNALFIGAGETIELAATHFKQQGLHQCHVANRTLQRAEKLAKKLNGQAYNLLALPALVECADIIISSTASPIPIIGKGLMEKVINARQHRTMFIVDLAIPRDIESEVAQLNDVYLYTVDDMQGVIQDNKKQRENAAIQAQNIIDHASESYMEELQALLASSILHQYTQHTHTIAEQEYHRSHLKIESLMQNFSNDEKDQLKKIMHEWNHRLTQKLMHSPRLLMKQAAKNNDPHLLKYLSHIFTTLPLRDKKKINLLKKNEGKKPS